MNPMLGAKLVAKCRGVSAPAVLKVQYYTFRSPGLHGHGQLLANFHFILAKVIKVRISTYS